MDIIGIAEIRALRVMRRQRSMIVLNSDLPNDERVEELRDAE